MNEIYMDYNATTPVREEALGRLEEVLREGFGNASSIHSPGRRAKIYLDEARTQVAASLGARPSEIVFTGGGSESDNLAIKGVAWTHGSGHIVTSAIEHPAVLSTCEFLERNGFEVSYLAVDSSGCVSPDAVKNALRDDTILISIMWANNETGVLQPMAAIAEIARERGVLFHTDAVQAFGKVPVNVGSMPVDLLSISGHKFYAPKGVGALFVRKNTALESLIHGGGQEGGLRSGTESVPAIAAMGITSELAVGELEHEAKRILALRDDMEGRLLSAIDGVRINGDKIRRLPNTSSITFDGAEGEAILISLDEHGIAASSASACAAGHTDPSHVLLAMGRSKREAEGAMRFSLGRYSISEHVDRLLDCLPGIVDRLRRLSCG